MTDVRTFDPDDVLAFWHAAGVERWYTRDDVFDAGVRERFLDLWQQALAGELSSWETTDDGALALVLVLDQFPRNMFRGDPKAYSSDALAREVAHRACGRAPINALRPSFCNFCIYPSCIRKTWPINCAASNSSARPTMLKTSDMPRNMPTLSAGSDAFRIETTFLAASRHRRNRPFSIRADFQAKHDPDPMTER
jgi:hypothetical protein